MPYRQTQLCREQTAKYTISEFNLPLRIIKHFTETLPLVFLDNFVLDTGKFALAENLGLFINYHNCLV